MAQLESPPRRGPVMDGAFERVPLFAGRWFVAVRRGA